MADLISRMDLFNKINALEDEALEKTLLCPSDMECPTFVKYKTQLEERTALKHDILDAAPVNAIVIPDDATFGQLVRKLLPFIIFDTETYSDVVVVRGIGTSNDDDGSNCVMISKKWWNSKYNEGGTINNERQEV